MPKDVASALPIDHPFRMYHKPRSPKKKLGRRHDYNLTWERKDLPDAGAQQYAWETYGLPPDAPFGFGNINVQQPLRATAPASYTFQAVGLVGNPPKSLMQGQFITQPLMDANAAARVGLVMPGAVTSPNAILTGSPTLNP